MSHGPPFEVFLSADADADRPKKAEQDGLGVPGLADDQGAVLKAGKFAHLSIAEPTAAPYGVAAVQTLQKLKFYDALTPKIVKGSSIPQAYQFVTTGAAEVGFVAQSRVINVPGGLSLAGAGK